MSSATLRSSVQTALGNVACLSAYTFVDSENNTQQTPAAGSTAWYTVVYPAGVEDQVSVGDPGSNRWRTEGMFFVRIFRPTGEGKTTLLTAAELVRSFLRGTMLTGGVHIGAVDPPDFDARYTEGSWSFVDVAVHYFMDVTG